MGAFLLIKKPEGVDVEGVERLYKDSIGVFEKKGLSLNKKLVTDEFVIYVFHKRQFKVDNVVVFDDDQFIISTGTLMYNGKMGHDALEEIYNDFSEDGKFLSDAIGEYCLIISRKGKMYLLNDYVGLSRIYADKKKSVISNSFLAVLKSLKTRTVSPQELYEYIIGGASYGIQTLIKEIDFLDGRTIWQISPELSAIPKIPSVISLDKNTVFDEMVREVAKNLVDYFHIIKENFENSVSLGLSGGYDSRLMLALLKNVGIKPLYLYVYDDSRQPTCVATAKAIAEGEGLELDYASDNNFVQVTADKFEAFIETQYYFNDGLVPVFDNGFNISHRLKRVEKAKLNLNGGCGEIYRNFWRIPHRNLSIESFVKTRYIVDFSMCTDRFDKGSYFSAFVDKIKAVLNINENRLNRRQLAMLLPFWMGRYWMGDNNTINNQISYALTPFVDIRLAFQSFDIPLKYRNYGIFQAALIKYIDADVAKYQSHYGYNFFDDMPIKGKIPHYVKLHTPVWLRAYIRKRFWSKTDIRLKLGRKQPDIPYYLSKEYLDRIFKLSKLNLSEYIDINKIKDLDILSRMLTAELVIDNRF